MNYFGPQLQVAMSQALVAGQRSAQFGGQSQVPPKPQVRGGAQPQALPKPLPSSM